MKKIVCGCFGTIYDAKILKDGLMSSSDRRECTEECVDAVIQHLMSMDNYQKNTCAGYEVDKKDHSGSLILCVYDTNKYKLVKKDE